MKRQVENMSHTEECDYKSIVENIDDAIALVDKQHNCKLANKAFAERCGLKLDELPGKSVAQTMGSAVYEKNIKPDLTNVFNGESFNRELELRMGKFAGRFIMKGVPLKNPLNGDVENALILLRDVTERSVVEDEIRKIQKLESVGALAGGIAHDFNNMLGTILGYTNLAQLQADDNEELVDHLNHIQEAVSRASRLTHQLLTFSKGGLPIKTKLSLQPLLRESCEFALSGSTVSVDYFFDDELFPVEADKELMTLVFQNLVVNAVQAMTAGGKIKVRASNIFLDVRNRPALVSGDYVKIEVADTGTGIQPEHLKNIFDPFFTTKERANGLGLATVFSVVRGHGGNITVDSKPGAGTSFAVYLPVIKDPNDTQAGLQQKARSVEKGKILVMDDDEDTRRYVKKVLEHMGYGVLLAADGDAAVELLKESISAGVPVTLAILDLTIRGGMGGVETLAKLLELDPSLKAVVASGYVNNAIMHDYEQHGFKAVLPKPYEISYLQKVIDSLVNGQNGKRRKEHS